MNLYRGQAGSGTDGQWDTRTVTWTVLQALPGAASPGRCSSVALRPLILSCAINFYLYMRTTDCRGRWEVGGGGEGLVWRSSAEQVTEGLAPARRCPELWPGH